MSGYQNEQQRLAELNKKKFFVKVIEARGLKGVNLGGMSDPFVEVRIIGHVDHFDTTVHKKTNDPVWNEEFILYPKDIEKEVLLFKIYSHNPVTSNHLLGEIEISLALAFARPCPQGEWKQLQRKVGPTTFHPERGELHVAYYFEGQAPSTTLPAQNPPPPLGQNPSTSSGQNPSPGQYPPPPPGQYPPQPGQYPPQPGQYPPQPGQYPPQPGQYPPPTGQYPPQPGQYPPQPGQYPPPTGQYQPRPGQYPPQAVIGQPQVVYTQPSATQYPGIAYAAASMGIPTPGGQIYSAIMSYDSIGGLRALRTYDGKWLVAESGRLFTHHNLQEHIDRALFTFETHGDNKISLRTSHGKYVAANSYHSVYLTQHHHEYETKFHIEWYNGRVSFRSHHLGYLGVDGFGEVRVSSHRGANELFEVINVV